MAAIEIGDVVAIRSNLGDNFLGVVVGVGDIVGDEDDAEVGSYGEGAGEQAEDRVGMGAGGDVEVFGRKAEEDIADTAAELVDIVAAVCSMTAGVIVIRLWKPGRIWRFGHEAEVTPVAVDVPLPPPPNFGEGAPGFSTPHIVCGPGRNRRL